MPTQNADIIQAALRKAGVLQNAGRPYSIDQYNDAIAEENRMIGSWNCGPLNVFAERIDLWPTVTNQQSYTIGIDPAGVLTADWQGPRPQRIVQANFLLPTAVNPIEKVRRPLKLWDRSQWGSIRFQAVDAYPEGLYCDYQSPLARIYFRPIPDGIYQIELYTWQRLQQFASGTDILILPDGWEDAIVNNLAVRLASYPWPNRLPMNPLVAMEAQRSLAMVQQMNARAPRLRSDKQFTAGRGRWNWLSGEWDDADGPG